MPLFPHYDVFQRRHIGPSPEETNAMLKALNVNSLDELIAQTVPDSIRMKRELDLPEPLNEQDYLRELKTIAVKNKVFRSYIGMGYHGTVTP
jgi:glycine dehydrogenase